MLALEQEMGLLRRYPQQLQEYEAQVGASQQMQMQLLGESGLVAQEIIQLRRSYDATHHGMTALAGKMATNTAILQQLEVIIKALEASSKGMLQHGQQLVYHGAAVEEQVMAAACHCKEAVEAINWAEASRLEQQCDATAELGHLQEAAQVDSSQGRVYSQSQHVLQDEMSDEAQLQHYKQHEVQMQHAGLHTIVKDKGLRDAFESKLRVLEHSVEKRAGQHINSTGAVMELLQHSKGATAGDYNARQS